MGTQYEGISKMLLESTEMSAKDGSTGPALGAKTTVAKCDAATHLPIIVRPVQPGRIIHSNEWEVRIATGTCNSISDS